MKKNIKFGERSILEVGTDVILTRTFADSEVKSQSKLIGWELGRFLILQLPVIDNVPMFRQVNDKCAIRYVHKGNMMGFATKVLDIIDRNDYKLLIVNFPTQIEKSDLRRFERYNVFLPAKAYYLNEIHKAILLDLSVSGAKVKLPAFSGVSIKQILELTVTLPTGIPLERIPVIIRHISEDETGQKICGVEFHYKKVKQNEWRIKEHIQHYLNLSVT